MRSTLIVLLACLAGRAWAENEPTPGECTNVQPGVKICAAKNGQGNFELVTFPPAIVFVMFEEPVIRVVRPPPAFFKTEARDNTVTIAPIKKDFPDRTPVVVTAGALTVTLTLRTGSLEKADTQVTILDPDRGARDAELERRVNEKLAPRLEELAAREKGIEQRANERAEQLILEELAQRGVEVRGPGGKGIARNDGAIVIRAKSVVRVGERRYVVMSVENRSPQDFEVKGVRIWQKEGGREHELKVAWRFAARTVKPAEEVQGAVFLPLTSAPSVKARFRMVVEEADPTRNVELGDIEVR